MNEALDTYLRSCCLCIAEGINLMGALRGIPQVKLRLHVHPALRGGICCLPNPYGHVRAKCGPAIQQRRQGFPGNPQTPGSFCYGKTKRSDHILPQNFAGMSWFPFVDHADRSFSLMIITIVHNCGNDLNRINCNPWRYKDQSFESNSSQLFSVVCFEGERTKIIHPQHESTHHPSVGAPSGAILPVITP